MRPEVSALIAACYNRGCAPPPVGTGGSSQSGPASRAARIRSVQSRGRAVQAVKSGAKGASRQLANARKKVRATETTTNNDTRGTKTMVDRYVKMHGRKPSAADVRRLQRNLRSGRSTVPQKV